MEVSPDMSTTRKRRGSLASESHDIGPVWLVSSTKLEEHVQEPSAVDAAEAFQARHKGQEVIAVQKIADAVFARPSDLGDGNGSQG
jgi:hypothetical protein